MRVDASKCTKNNITKKPNHCSNDNLQSIPSTLPLCTLLNLTKISDIQYDAVYPPRPQVPYPLFTSKFNRHPTPPNTIRRRNSGTRQRQPSQPTIPISSGPNSADTKSLHPRTTIRTSSVDHPSPSPWSWSSSKGL